MNQYRGGNTFWMDNINEIHGGEQGCLRKILLRHHGIEPGTDTSSRYIFKVGDWVEGIVQKEIEMESPEMVLGDDVEVKEPITEGTEFCGHEDLVEYREDKPYRCIELKSCWSTNTLKKIFGEKKWKTGNMLQLMHYMLSFETVYGTLRYTSLIFHTFTYKGDRIKVRTGDYYEFQVEIKEDGFFYVDGVKTIYDAAGFIRAREAAADILDNNKVHDKRPLDCDGWNSCNFCPFKSVCDIQEKWEDSEEFLKLCRDLVEEKEKPKSLF